MRFASMLFASMLFASMLFTSMRLASMRFASMRFASMLFGGPHLHAHHEVHRPLLPLPLTCTPTMQSIDHYYPYPSPARPP